MIKSVFIIGCGYVGRRLALQLIERETTVSALTRTEAHLDELGKLGIKATLGDLDEPASLPRLPVEGSVLYHFTPPPRCSEKDPRVSNLLNVIGDKTPAKVVYLSTTGVYGNCHGEWIDETRPLNPEADRAKRRVDAEQSYQSWCDRRGIELTILRVAGIYGPGKLPRARLERGEPVLAEADSPYTNRIHIDDLVDAAVAVGEIGVSSVYNIADGNPSTMTDYFNRVADHLSLPRPAQLSRSEAEKVLGEGMKSYLAESRRIDNSKLKQLLGGKLKHPGLRYGLKAC